MMRILLIPDYYSPEVFSSSYLFDNRNQAFVEAGYDLLIYTPSPTRGVERGVKYNRHETQFDGHLQLYRFKMIHESKSTVKRFIRYFLCSFVQLVKGLYSKNYNMVFVGSTPPFQGFVGALLKILRNKKFVFAIQDIFPDSLVGAGLTHEGSLLWKIGNLMEIFAYKKADRLIVISNDFKQNLIDKGVPEEKIVVVYNWVDQNAVVDVPREENKLFDKYHLDRNKFYVTYCGNIGLTQNLDMLVAASEELSDNNDIHFVLVGNGAYWETLVAKLKEKRTLSGFKAEDGTEALTFGNITLLPFQPYDDISHVFSLGDVSIIISKPGVGANSVPSKTWSIMSASRPVIANFDENEIKSILDDNHCGIFTKAGDKEAFKQAILTLYNDKELCKEYGRNGRKFILRNLTKEVGTSKYVEVIKSVTRQ